MKKIIMVCCTVAAFAHGASYAADPVKVTPPQNKTLSSEGGRFVFGQISEFRRDQYMLDTRTGRLWRAMLRSLNPDGTPAPGEGALVLEPVPYQDAKGALSPEPR